ncbi:uncharacterized protein LOC124964776 [Sciurus carolinensis]|uniref:uncharacterized protein LOC124964776 n=1 Tax=Sciurus carolinensis TaxID=30640 RepID=UPI001FB2843D|nr:uncharacterized protein LOC124964776 [Sciurus carolinensis]
MTITDSLEPPGWARQAEHPRLFQDLMFSALSSELPSEDVPRAVTQTAEQTVPREPAAPAPSPSGRAGPSLEREEQECVLLTHSGQDGPIQDGARTRLFPTRLAQGGEAPLVKAPPGTDHSKHDEHQEAGASLSTALVPPGHSHSSHLLLGPPWAPELPPAPTASSPSLLQGLLPTSSSRLLTSQQRGPPPAPAENLRLTHRVEPASRPGSGERVHLSTTHQHIRVPATLQVGKNHGAGEGDLASPRGLFLRGGAVCCPALGSSRWRTFLLACASKPLAAHPQNAGAVAGQGASGAPGAEQDGHHHPIHGRGPWRAAPRGPAGESLSPPLHQRGPQQFRRRELIQPAQHCQL